MATEVMKHGLRHPEGDLPCTAGVQQRWHRGISMSKPHVVHSSGRRQEGNRGKEKGFCCFLSWRSLHRSEGAITAGAGVVWGQKPVFQLARSALPSHGASPQSAHCSLCSLPLVSQ